MARVRAIGRRRLGPAARRALIPGSGLVLLSSATGGMHGDIFQLYVVDTLGYSPSLVSVIALGMIVSIPVQLLAPGIVSRFGHRTVMVAGSLTLAPALLLLFSAGLIIDGSRIAAAAVLFAGATVAGVGISICFGAAWTAWYVEFAEPADRPLFLAMFSFAAQGTVIMAFLVQTVCFDGAVTEVFYRGVVIYCLIYLLGSIIVYRHLPETTVREPISTFGKGGWREALRDHRGRLVVFGSAAQFVIGVPLLAVYALTVLDLPAAAIGVMLIVRSAASFVFAPVAGWFIGRIGTTTSIRVLGVALAAQMVLWTLLPRVGHHLAAIAAFTVLVVLSQVSRYAFGLAMSAIAFDVVEPEHRVRTFALVDAVSSAAMHLNLAAGGALVAASSTAALLDTSWIRLDPVKIVTAAGTVIIAYLTVAFHRMATGFVKQSLPDETTQKQRTIRDEM
ncbi:MFS transporter [Mycobacterium sp. smrl_JER01]|uniref:MFS transporter n=1 Tax=Mycobacterium sp. smrl_JER01 TaxID=3402633 RepID=UPI003AC08F3E